MYIYNYIYTYTCVERDYVCLHVCNIQHSGAVRSVANAIFAKLAGWEFGRFLERRGGFWGGDQTAFWQHRSGNQKWSRQIFWDNSPQGECHVSICFLSNSLEFFFGSGHTCPVLRARSLCAKASGRRRRCQSCRFSRQMRYPRIPWKIPTCPDSGVSMSTRTWTVGVTVVGDLGGR